MKNEIRFSKYNCQKCGGRDCDIETISTTGDFLTKIFNIQTKKFTAVTCKRCTYTELYKTKGSKLENVFDFISG